MKKQYTLSAFVENTPGVLHRLTIVFTRRRINIESLTVSETEQHHISRFTIVVRLEERYVPIIVRQLCRIVEVQQAYASEDEDLLFKEIALYKVRAKSPEERAEIEELASRFNAVPALIEPEFIVFEKTGPEDEIDGLYALLEPFGILEFIRSGRVAIRRRPLPTDVGIDIVPQPIEPTNAGEVL